MSYTHIATDNPTARKNHDCGWCGETILIGEKHTKWTGVLDSAMTSTRVHAECAEAFGRDNSVGGEFTLHEGLRGHSHDEQELHEVVVWWKQDGADENDKPFHPCPVCQYDVEGSEPASTEARPQ